MKQFPLSDTAVLGTPYLAIQCMKAFETSRAESEERLQAISTSCQRWLAGIYGLPILAVAQLYPDVYVRIVDLALEKLRFLA